MQRPRHAGQTNQLIVAGTRHRASEGLSHVFTIDHIWSMGMAEGWPSASPVILPQILCPRAHLIQETKAFPTNPGSMFTSLG